MDTKIYGILKYENEERSFVYQDWNLTILPNKIKMDSNQRKRFFEKINNPKYVIGTIELFGMTHDHKNLLFKVPELCSQIENLIHYSVISISIFDSHKNDYSIEGISIQGDIINSFYPPEEVFKHKNLEEQDGNFEFSLVTENLKSPLIEVNIKSKKLDIEINFSTTTKYNHNSTIPFQSYSNMILRFSSAITVEQTIEIIFDLMNFYSLINYSLEIGLDRISILEFSDDKYIESGYLLIKSLTTGLKISRSREDVIFNDFVNDINNLKNIINLYLNEHLNNRFIAENLSVQKSISSSRVIQVTAAYEKYLEDVFGLQVISQKYYDAKNDILGFIDIKIQEISTKETRSFKSIRNLVNRHVPLNEKLGYLKKSDIDFVDMVETIFGEKLYSDTMLFDRLSMIRNSIAHGDVSIDITTKDIRRIRYLIVCVYYLFFLKANVSSDMRKLLVKKIFSKT
ncbi:MAG: hypothetical protein CVU96_06440 [Firmicutes bacterium HGW-Firmicutes-20]|jgi:hypothetical protein|nr:MAG: hypothetical protein CVU96_06440 [Firmicutes bacterium HGW-Firmicutes-20]PKM67795.1 MAG: hypothetical protein CVU94_05990 [Firmicutes bacterium HGW-Firmicutes-19]